MTAEHHDLRPALMELVDGGMRQAEIARAIGLSRATVNIVLKQQSAWMPRYDTGRRLVELLSRRRAQAARKRIPAEESEHA